MTHGSTAERDRLLDSVSRQARPLAGGAVLLPEKPFTMALVKRCLVELLFRSRRAEIGPRGGWRFRRRASRAGRLGSLDAAGRPASLRVYPGGALPVPASRAAAHAARRDADARMACSWSWSGGCGRRKSAAGPGGGPSSRAWPGCTTTAQRCGSARARCARRAPITLRRCEPGRSLRRWHCGAPRSALRSRRGSSPGGRNAGIAAGRRRSAIRASEPAVRSIA